MSEVILTYPPHNVSKKLLMQMGYSKTWGRLMLGRFKFLLCSYTNGIVHFPTAYKKAQDHFVSTDREFLLRLYELENTKQICKAMDNHK
jgi:hypothetical protein